MLVGILGASGFVGSNLVKELGKQYDIQPITKENYRGLIGSTFDILINANGNSKKYLAEKNPPLDFQLSVQSTYDSLYDFDFKRYIYISSIDVYKGSAYGYNRNICETIIKDIFDFNYVPYSILRCGSIIGPNLKKGIIYDIINNNTLRVSLDSKIYLTDIKQILDAINPNVMGREIDLFSKNNITVKKIAKLLEKQCVCFSNSEKQMYEGIVSDSNLTAEQILKRNINDLLGRTK